MIWTSFLCLLLTIGVQAVEIRRFAAAPKSSHLKRRAYDFAPTRGKHSLLFEDASSDTAADVQLTTKYPTLILDDVSDHIRDVTCSSSTMIVHFHDTEAMHLATYSWSTESDLVFISTHSSCAVEGEHQAYMVQYSSHNASSKSVTLAATKQTLRDATRRISVGIGTHVVNAIESKVKRRQTANTSAIASIASSDYQTASIPPTVSFDFQAPTATPTGTKTEKDIAYSRVNKAILPPDQAIIDMFPGIEPLAFVSLDCKDCTVNGKVTLEAAGFDVDSNQLGQVIDFFDNGYFQFTAKKLTARMAFEVALKNGFTGAPFEAKLVKIPLTPIALPGVITFGPVLELTIPMTVTLNSPVNFTTGFELTVPDDSKIIMNVSNIGGSSQAGFDRTTIKALPFDMNADNLSFNVTAALRPKLTISAGVGNPVLGLGVNGGVGAFLDLPKLIARIDSVQNVNATCNGPAPNGAINRGIRVTPSSALDVGLHWELGFEVGKIGQDRDGEQVLASRTYPLPNQCLIFDQRTRPQASTRSEILSNSGSVLNKRSLSGAKAFSSCLSPNIGPWVVLLVLGAAFSSM